MANGTRRGFLAGAAALAAFASPEQLVRDLMRYGYYGGIRLLKAVAKRFWEWCRKNGVVLPKRNFTAEYKINIPRLVGLSGSSAICSAMLKALMKFYEVEIPLKIAPTICLEAIGCRMLRPRIALSADELADIETTIRWRNSQARRARAGDM